MVVCGVMFKKFEDYLRRKLMHADSLQTAQSGVLGPLGRQKPVNM